MTEQVVCTSSSPQDIGGGRLAFPNGEPVETEITAEVRALIHAGLIARAPKKDTDKRHARKQEERRDG